MIKRPREIGRDATAMHAATYAETHRQFCDNPFSHWQTPTAISVTRPTGVTFLRHPAVNPSDWIHPLPGAAARPAAYDRFHFHASLCSSCLCVDGLSSGDLCPT